MTKRKIIAPAAEASGAANNGKLVHAEASAKRSKRARAAATPTTDPAATLLATESSPAPAAKKRTKNDKPTKSDKMSALDAAAKVLAEKGEPMTCKEMIETMAKKGYWLCRGRHNRYYADSRIMPTGPQNPRSRSCSSLHDAE